MSSFATLLLGVPLLVWQNTEPATTFRGSAPLPGSVTSLSQVMGIGSGEASTVVLRTIRLLYGTSEARANRARPALLAYLRTAELGNELVPLPLDPQLWTDVILQTRPSPDGVVAAILKDRTAALVYHGLSALDDETLRWFSTNRNSLLHARRHPEIFAAFGRSIHVRDGGVITPGGLEAESLWRSVVGVDPARADAFIERVLEGDGRLALVYDVIAHLDKSHQRFALGLWLPPASREARLRSLLAAFTAAAPEWKVTERPFSRPPLDGAILLSAIGVTAGGDALPPLTRRVWDQVFRGDDLNDVAYEEVSDRELRAVSESLVIDASWLADRILRVPYAIGRRRLDTLLFAERIFSSRSDAESAEVTTALRGYLSFPALMIALERMGISDPGLFVRAAEHAARLNRIQAVSERRLAIAECQSGVVLISRVERVRVIEPVRATSLLKSLFAIEISSRNPYAPAFATWLRSEFFAALPTRTSLEETVVAALAGVGGETTPTPIVEWEGRRYRVDPAGADFTRIRAIRQVQGGATLDEALSSDEGQMLADALLSIVYAIHLGNPEGLAVTSGNVAQRHDFGLAASPDRRASDAWRPPLERFDGKEGWRVRGSLLGLETALARLALRRIDRTAMPGEPTIGSSDRQTLMLTAALLNSALMSDASRDTIASAIARGRAAVAALADHPSQAREVADAAGFSEWRAQALIWSAKQRRDLLSSFSLVELFWLGLRRPDSMQSLDAWGAATLPLTGCLCLQFPPPVPWENHAGYATEVLATRAADIPLRVAETLFALKLPAILAPALAGYVTQDVIDHARLGYPDDWEAFGGAVLEVPRERMVDYVAAMTVDGPLVEIK